MALIIVIKISMTTIYLPWIMNRQPLRNIRYISYPIKVKWKTIFCSRLRKEREKCYPGLYDHEKPHLQGGKLVHLFKSKIESKKHNHDIPYYNECPEEQTNENYIGETGRWISERIIDHARRDSKIIYLWTLYRTWL